MSKPFLIGTVVVIVGSFAGGFLLWQRNVENNSLRDQRDMLKANVEMGKSEKSSLEAINSELQQEQETFTVIVQDIRAKKEEFERLISFMISAGGVQNLGLPAFSEEERSIRVIEPNGGENLCMGDDFEIRWESSNLERVQIMLLRGGGGGRVAEFYPSTGSYAWQVGQSESGKLFEPGEGYFFTITSYDGGFGVFDESDKTFIITQCIG